MADIRCPNCGKLNPDVLDVCQFCQAPLKTESMLHLGDKPTKKNTGELEPVLPDWLRDIRQQARSSAAEDAQSASLSRDRKEEPPDLLAGLMSQSQNAEDDEIPDWLSRLNSTTKKEKSVPAPPAAPETDFFAQFNKSEPAAKNEPQQETKTSWQSEQNQAAPERDELSDWFAKASDEPVETLSTEQDLSQVDADWGIQAEESRLPQQPQSAPEAPEDLSWLHNLEAESKKTGELSSPDQETDWFAEHHTPAPASPGQEDLSWLNDLGRLPATEAPVPSSSELGEDMSWLDNLGALPATNEPAAKPDEQKEDLSWLNNLGGVPASDQPVQAPPERTEDLSWLNDLGGTPIPEPSSPTASQPQEDLSWMNAFSEHQQPAQPSAPSAPAADDLSWLNDLGAPQPTQAAAADDLGALSSLQGSEETLSAASHAERDQEQPIETTPDAPHVSPFTPRQTAPLFPEEEDTSIPDWLKSATETPSLPLGAGALDQFREDYKIPTGPEEPFSWKSFVPEAKQDDEQSPLTAPEPALPDADLLVPARDTPALSNQDVDSLFSVNMPDWLSSQPAAEEEVEKPTEEIGIHAEGGEMLTPADLPSWVQAMRPVEAVLGGTPAVEEQPAEREGPLAGFKGVIPAVPIGSSRRPQPVPLKLQASAEQQASAAIMEQILASETSPRALLAAPTFASQRMLRLIIAGILLVALSAAIFLRTQFLPVSPILPLDAGTAMEAVELIPDSSSVLVVLDYEPALAGEMEAVSGPLLNHIATLRHPNLSFISTSTNGPGLVDRLLRNTTASNSDGLAYQEGVNYFNLGYLPGGESGVLSFLQSPQTAIPAARANLPGAFSGYSAVVLLTDHADSARSWIEQLQTAKQADSAIANQPLLVVSSAQAGPMLQPYASSRQISGLVNGLSDAARLEASTSRPGMARSYWDAFGAGVSLAVLLIVLGSLWSLVANIRARRVEPGEA